MAVWNLHRRILLVVVDHRVFRHRQHALVLVQQNLRVGRHVGLQLAARIVDRHANLECRHVVFFHSHRRNLRHFSVKQPVMKALHLDARWLPHVDMRNVRFVHLALHVHFRRIALSHDQRGRRPQHQNRAHRIADLHVPRQNHAVHRRHNGCIRQLLLKLLQTGLALLHLRLRLLQLRRVHTNLRLG